MAPVYETPEGVAPGALNTTVRMLDEQVDVQVVEKGPAAVAVVTTTFDMINDGPAAEIMTSFPDEYFAAHCCFLEFTSANITGFRAWTDTDADLCPAFLRHSGFGL
jgi:hypothetical protein